MKKEKTYIVLSMYETDGDPRLERMTGKQIRDNLGKFSTWDIAIIEGNVIKDFDTEYDLTRL